MNQVLVTLCLGFITLGLLTSCSEGARESPPLPVIPQYPDAQQMRVDGNINSDKPRQHTSFKTNDTPSAVLTFYRDNLLNHRWELGKEGLGKGVVYTLIEGCQLSILDIVAKANEAQQTLVELELSSQYCD